MQDRVPLYPGRVKLNPVAGQDNTFDIVRADEPTQDGTPLNKETLLKDSTAALLGLTNTAVPDDAFVALILGQGVYGYRVKVQLKDGTPVEGATVSGIKPLTGSTLVTGADGIVLGKSTSANVTIGCTSPYIDQKNPPAQAVAKVGTITDVTLTLENISDMITVNSSKTTKISQMVKTIDIFASGGGGGGGNGSYGGGGGGGYADSKLNMPISGSIDIDIIIGSGGAGGARASYNTYYSGKDGGTTTVSIGGTAVLTASGGAGGFSSLGSGHGGAGNGPGGNMNGNGSDASVYVFDDPTIGIKTGGGGGGGGGNSSGYKGGTPYGGSGGYTKDTGSGISSVGGKSGGIGGGGGGGVSYDITIMNGGNGGSGIVYLRFHFKEV